MLIHVSKVMACLILKKEIRLVPHHTSLKLKRNDNNTILGLENLEIKLDKKYCYCFSQQHFKMVDKGLEGELEIKNSASSMIVARSQQFY